MDCVTRGLTPLFNPRRHKWARHFQWEGPYLAGRTAIGRVTAELLRINDPFRVEFREELMAEGLFPPGERMRGEQERRSAPISTPRAATSPSSPCCRC